MKFLPFLLLVFLQSGVLAQKGDTSDRHRLKDTVYADENNNVIDKRLFDYKFNSSIYYGLRFENDTVVLDKLRLSHLFGQLEKTKKEQFFKFLTARNQVDTTKIMVIHYQDTLKRIVDFPKTDIIVFNRDSSSHTHVYSHKSFISQHKNCLRYFKRNKKANIYHFFSVNTGHPLNYKKCHWEKDPINLIKNMFRDKYQRFNVIVIHPDGNFYCFNFSDNAKNIKVYKDILKGKNWEKHIQEFTKKITTLNSL